MTTNAPAAPRTRHCPKCDGWLYPETVRPNARAVTIEWHCIRCGKTTYEEVPHDRSR